MKIRDKKQRGEKNPFVGIVKHESLSAGRNLLQDTSINLVQYIGKYGRNIKKSKGSKNRRGKLAVGKKRIDDFQNARVGRKELSRRQLLSARERKSVKVENPEKRTRTNQRTMRKNHKRARKSCTVICDREFFNICTFVEV